jgi:autotransporter-associated beta strand protein
MSSVLYLYNSAQTVGPLSGTITQPSSGNTASIFLNTGTTLTVNQTAAGTFQGYIYGGGNLVLGSSSTNTLTLTATSVYTGSTTISGGTIESGVANALPATTQLSLATTGSSGNLNLNNYNQTVGGLSGGSSTSGIIITGSGIGGVLTVVNPNSGTSTYAGAISGTGGLVLGVNNTNGPNNLRTLLLTGASTYTGPTTINSGTLQTGANYVLTGGVLPVGPYTNPPSTYPGTFTLAASANALLNLNNFNLAIGSLQGGGPVGGNINLGNGNGQASTGGTLQIIQTINTVYAGVISGNGNLVVGGTGGGVLELVGNNTFQGNVSADLIVLGSTNTLPTTVNVIFNGSLPSDGIDMNGFNQQVGTISGGSAVNDSGNGTWVDSKNSGSKLTVAYASSNPYNGGVNTFSGVFSNDVSVFFDASFNNVSQTVILTGNSTTTGNFSVGNAHTNSAATTTVVVNSILGDDGTINTNGVSTLTIGKGGIVAGIGTINLITTVSAGTTGFAGGVIRGGFSDGTNNYGTLTFGDANVVANGFSANLTLNAGTTSSSLGATLQTEVTRTGANTANASLIVMNSGNFNISGNSTTKSININILDTTGSLVAGETYTFVLVEAVTANGSAIQVGGSGQAAGTVIDSASTPSGLGASSAGTLHKDINLSLTNNPAFNSAIRSWSLSVDPTGQYLDLTVNSAAVPEPEHIMLLCAGVLLAGFAIRRRWRQRDGPAASVA